ncbi:MAG: 5-(carboxyamino)imidazole ribonucleotide synthase [Burkholderiales bacterium]|nr:5-(carboxyamino)imidazole ribonucleotide synthase [Phycisphaerae bacterium]
MYSTPVVLPGKTIGILGGGQLGRMFAIAARRMGYRVHAFDPTRDCPTGQVADHEVNAPYDDLDAARRFASAVDVVTFEFENVPSQTLAAIEKLRPVHPSPFVLDTTRHRLREKDFLSANGFPVAPYRSIRDVEELRRAISELGTPCVLKTAEFGYDGKGQSRIESIDDADDAWRKLNCPLGVLEGFIRFDREISVIVGRNARGESRTFDVFENVHVNHILDLTTVSGPGAGLPWSLQEKAIVLARDIARKIDLIGLLCVEMFVTGSDVIVNELAPRPHNSGHVTFDACVTSQFEQQLRAVCDLPLGDTTLLRPAAMANLLGDVWIAADGEPAWDRALADPRVKLHLYGKSDAKPGRKMGHLTALADTAAAARDHVLAARNALAGSSESHK